MKRIVYILALTLVATACRVVELEPVSGSSHPQPEGQGILTFGLSLPDAPATRSMGAVPGTDMDLRLAAFGSTGFLKEYVKASPVTGRYPDADGNYYFTALLSISEQTRNVHLIINGPEELPFLSEDEVLTGAYTSGIQDSYWQRVQIAKGIRAKKDWDDAAQQWVYKKDNGKYVLEDDVVAAFSNITMIRNFAQIRVESVAPNFELDENHAFIVLNKPDRGSIAPYNVRTGAFMSEYWSMTYQEMHDSYPGYMPVDVKVGLDNPPLTDNSSFLAAGTADYMYERTKPSQSVPATYLIVYGKYYPDETKKNEFIQCYYKINLMDQNGYYIIYRNFRYNIKITKVDQVGATTPSGADVTGGTGNITWNTDISGNLNDISDGIGRIYLSYTSVSLPTQQSGVELKYKFIPDVNLETPVTDNDAVIVSINQPNSFGNVFADTYEGYNPAEQTLLSGPDGTGVIAINNENDDQGWRSIFFDTVLAGDAIKTQKISIRGVSASGSFIDREVIVNLLDRQNLIVNCRTKHVEKDLNASVVVDISIPKNLPESMFPLVFDLETADGTLTPDPEPKDSEGNIIVNNLPVYSGPSIIDPSKVGFMFKRTLSYNEYLALTKDEEVLVSFTSYFNPNKLESATTIYANNAEYFNIGYDSFSNYRNFSDMYFSVDRKNPVYSFSFSTETGYRPGRVYVRLDGLEPDTGCPLKAITGRPDEYYYDLPQNTDSFTINNLRNVGSEEYTVTISTEDEANMYLAESVTGKRAVYGTGSETEIQINANSALNSGQTYTSQGVSLRFSNATFTDSRYGTDYMSVNNNSTLNVSSQDYLITSVTVNYSGRNYGADISVDNEYGNPPQNNTGYFSYSSVWTYADGLPSQTFNLARRNTNGIRVTNVVIRYVSEAWVIPD